MSTTADISQRPAHTRQVSTQDRVKPARSSPTLAKSPVDYTVIIRLPFNRNDFVDPAPVEWDSVKDKALWKIISKGSDMRNLDWEDIAARFDVSLAFLMKQAAWLYERHFAGVRKQMQRLATVSTPSPAPSIRIQDDKLPPLDTVGSLNRRGSKKSQPQSPRTRDSPVARPEAPPFSRTPSTATITQSRLATSARQSFQRPLRVSGTKPISPRQQQLELSDNVEQTQALRSTSEEDSILARSQAFRRPPLSSKPTLGGLSSEGDVEDDDDDDDDEESSSVGFLPFATRQDPQATLRGEPQRGKSKREATSSSTSSASSTQPQSDNSKDVGLGPRPGPLSPKHRAQLKQLSPRSTRKDIGSDDTPSMGSSFSDLDDAGISASALEAAVLSNMQAGGASIASRVSGLSQAFRSQK